MVPFENLKKDNVIAAKGTHLGEILSHVIVINERYFHGISGDIPNYIYVYDGDYRIRKIKFDCSTYIIVEDTIVRENITSIEQIKDINFYFPKPRKSL